MPDTWPLSYALTSRRSFRGDEPPEAGAAPAGWTPASLASPPGMWLDAQTPASLTIATGVSQWTDRSGSGNHAVQGTAGNQPTYSGSGVAAGVTLSAGKFLTSNLTANSDVQSIFAVVNIAAAATSRTVLGASATGGRQLRISSTDYLQSIIQATGVHTDAQDLVITEGSKQIIGVAYNVFTQTFYYLNGSQSTGAGSTIVDGSGFNQQGAKTTIVGDNPGDTEPMGGVMHEIVVLNANPTTGDRQSIEGYLAWRWGIQSLLPGGHPYKLAAP